MTVDDDISSPSPSPYSRVVMIVLVHRDPGPRGLNPRGLLVIALDA